MNNILNKRINSNLTQIIGSYLLIDFPKTVNNLNELYSKTLNIRWILRDNICNDDFGVLYNDLENTRIRCIKKSIVFWTIRRF